MRSNLVDVEWLIQNEDLYCRSLALLLPKVGQYWRNAIDGSPKTLREAIEWLSNQRFKVTLTAPEGAIRVIVQHPITGRMATLLTAWVELNTVITRTEPLMVGVALNKQGEVLRDPDGNPIRIEPHNVEFFVEPVPLEKQPAMSGGNTRGGRKVGRAPKS
jgi:hypothetical protein